MTRWEYFDNQKEHHSAECKLLEKNPSLNNFSKGNHNWGPSYIGVERSFQRIGSFIPRSHKVAVFEGSTYSQELWLIYKEAGIF